MIFDKGSINYSEALATIFHLVLELGLSTIYTAQEKLKRGVYNKEVSQKSWKCVRDGQRKL